MERSGVLKLRQNSNHVYIKSLSIYGLDVYFTNMHCRYEVLNIGDKEIPISISDFNYDDCYNVSFYSAFISSPKLTAPTWARPLLSLSGLLFKLLGVNKIVIVNNYLLGNNFGLKLKASEVRKLHDVLVAKFPMHIIVYRSLYESIPSLCVLMNELRDLNYVKLPVMHNYFFDHRSDLMKKRDIKRDKLHLSQDSNLFLDCNLEPKDYCQIIDLYNQLYINKYNRFSPQFGQEFIELTYQSNFIKYFVLRDKKTGKIEAVNGLIDWGDLVSCPIIGYNQKLKNTYRKAFLLGLQYAYDNGKLYAAGTGVRDYKLNRGAVKNTEFALLYLNHLKGIRGALIRGVFALINFFTARFLSRC